MSGERDPAKGERDPWIIIDDIGGDPAGPPDVPEAARTWNGMSLAPPGAGSRPVARAPAPEPEAAPEDVPDDRAVAPRRPRVRRFRARTFVPTVVTLAIVCVSVLLVVSSVVWRPYVP
ncbi:hypothetical protein BJF79_32380 [Actinomadura sp. CNU-125]|uniref:hypothetical protein n=1 Tax=Actinomadura sp. CNU-125 TaxID=1904961 RepID=UPI000965C2E8|nr:hypothetical protein [Actinomadura sp. CNU-125]OLT35457.1 hypothetical protein BJF79_32380 [Actinomadura sp. CNU-125]